VRELGTMIGNAVAPAGNVRPLPPASPASYTQTPRPTSTFSFAGTEAPKSGGVLNRLMGRPAPPSAPPDQPAGIAASVEEFLQARLLGSSEFAQRSIHIRPSLDHGIKIEVDSRYYDSIDEVDDPAIREYLLGMMREWEARQ
jgi:hypothetical protein